MLLTGMGHVTLPVDSDTLFSTMTGRSSTGRVPDSCNKENEPVQCVCVRTSCWADDCSAGVRL